MTECDCKDELCETCNPETAKALEARYEQRQREAWAKKGLCASCGHPKSSHSGGLGMCRSYDHSLWCRCSRFSRS